MSTSVHHCPLLSIIVHHCPSWSTPVRYYFITEKSFLFLFSFLLFPIYFFPIWAKENPSGFIAGKVISFLFLFLEGKS
tara:strand:+ start:2936 stop:3169 length:234 start_codon:yes stop_codon:yes gene_type:complete